MNPLAILPIDDAPAEPAAPLPCWPDGVNSLLPRTPLPETEEVDWDQWDSAVRWHDSKCGDL